MKPIDARLSVGELLARHPCTAAIFISRRMACLGCPTERFHTLEDVARIHRYRLREWLETIDGSIRAHAARGGADPTRPMDREE